MKDKYFFLKSKDKKLVTFHLEKNYFNIGGQTIESKSIRIDRIHIENSHLLPDELSNINEDTLSQWIEYRVSPVGQRLLAILKEYKKHHIKNDPLFMARYTNLLSLNDTFWIAEEDDKTWNEVNLYNNPFNKDIAELAFSGNIDAFSLERARGFALRSPEFTSKGNLRKCWLRQENDLFLLKEDTLKQGYNQACAEWFAQQVADLLGIEHIHYDLRYYRHRASKRQSKISICKIFTSENVGYLEAYKAHPDINPKTYLGQMRLQEALGEDFYSDMMILDVLIANHDRHMGNFGYLFDTDTGKKTGPAPVFDNGFSLFSMSTISRKTDFSDFRRQHGCAFLDFETQTAWFLRERHLESVEKLLNFEFTPHPTVKIADRVIEHINTFVQNQAQYVLDLSTKLDLRMNSSISPK